MAAAPLTVPVKLLDKSREAGGKGLAVQKIEHAPNCICRSCAVLMAAKPARNFAFLFAKQGDLLPILRLAYRRNQIHRLLRAVIQFQT